MYLLTVLRVCHLHGILVYWNTGMMEYWNDGQKRITSEFGLRLVVI